MGEFIIAQKSLILFDKKVLLLQYSSIPWESRENKWGFVGGSLEFGESLSEGLAREIKEETGLTVCVDKLLCAAMHYVANLEDSMQWIHLYYLSYANTNEITLSDEHKDYLWATRTQITDLVEDKAVLRDIMPIIDEIDIE